MAKVESKDHAVHNETACLYLDAAAKFPDWVITTSFYTSLHYLSSKMFPFKVAVGKTQMKVNDFDHYHSIMNNTKKKRGRHERFKDLVEDKCPDVSIHYSKLLDLSITARYTEYNYDQKFVDNAKAKMKIIKDFCTAPKKLGGK